MTGKPRSQSQKALTTGTKNRKPGSQSIEPRPYTGNKDLRDHALPGTKRLVDWILFFSPGARCLGIYANRPVRGGQARSVHQTGRAADIGAPRELLHNIIDGLYRNRAELHIEELHDYIGAFIPDKGFGAGYRCDRDTGGLFSGWRIYERNTIGKGGSWVHLELAPDYALDADLVDQAFTQILSAPKETTNGD